MSCKVQTVEVPIRWKAATRFNLVLFRGDRLVAVATERDDNPGPSITNAAEHLASWVLNREAVSPADMIWVEHYASLKETWDLVSFSWSLKDGKWSAFCPVWKPLTSENVKNLMCDQYEDFACLQSGCSESVDSITDAIMESCEKDIDFPDSR